MKLPKKLNQILAKAGIKEVEFFAGSKKQWIIGILIILSPIIIFITAILMITIKFWPTALERLVTLISTIF